MCPAPGQGRTTEDSPGKRIAGEKIEFLFGTGMKTPCFSGGRTKRRRREVVPKRRSARGRKEAARRKMRRDTHKDSPERAKKGEEKHGSLLVRLSDLRGEEAQGRSAQGVEGGAMLTGTVGGHDDFLA